MSTIITIIIVIIIIIIIIGAVGVVERGGQSVVFAITEPDSAAETPAESDMGERRRRKNMTTGERRRRLVSGIGLGRA